jgi:hypothetical protein
VKTAVAFACAVILIAMLFPQRAAKSCRPGSVEALFTDCGGHH